MFPASATLQKYVQQLPSQENANCCTASATLLAAEMIMSTAGKKINFSRLYVYYMTRKLQDRVGQKGAQLRDTLEALRIYGAASESQWPFSYSRIDKEPHLPAIEEGVHYKLQSYETITISEYKDSINKNIPIVIGISTGRMFWSLEGPLEKQRYKPVNGTDNRQSVGHAVTIIGYDDNICDGSWIIANSSGPKWGFRGYGAIPYKCNMDIGESYIITNFAGITIGKKIP
jgi:C1A family cysteine protease